MAADFTFATQVSHGESVAAGSALRGSRLLRRQGAWEEVALPTKSAPERLQAEAAQLRSRLEAAKAEVERKHVAWSRVSKGPEAAQRPPGDIERLEARLAHAEADAEAQRSLAQAAKLEVVKLQGLLETSRAEAIHLRSCLPQADATPASNQMDELVSRPSAEELQRELAEVQRKLQDTASAWAAASAKNLELQQQMKAHPSRSMDYADQVVTQYERRVKDLMDQLQAKCSEVSGLKEKLGAQELQMQKTLHEPERGLVNALEFEEQLSASHERRNTQLSEQLQAKRQEVAILKEHLQVKSEEIKQICAARPFQRPPEEDPLDQNKQLQDLQAQQLLLLKEQLAAQEAARDDAQKSEARIGAKVAELSTSLERQKEAAAAGAKLLRAAQVDCQEMWVVWQEREEERRRTAALQQRMQEVRSQQEDMAAAWRQATTQAADLEAAMELQHLAAVNVVQEQEAQRRLCEGRSLQLATEVDEQQETLSELQTRLKEAEAERRGEALCASRFQAESKRAEQLQEEASTRLEEAEQAAKLVGNLEEEARSLSERLELAEQFTEGYERRNSELAEQLNGKRKELASLKARMAAKTTEHEEAMNAAEIEARQLQAASQERAHSEAEMAAQASAELAELRRRFEDDGLSEARAMAKMSDELATAHQRSLAAQAVQRQSVEQARAVELELEETTAALRRTEAACAAAQADVALAQQRYAAQEGQLEALSAEFEASEARSFELEGALTQQLRHLDPSIGHSLRGVSIHHLSAQFLELVLQAGLGMEASLEEAACCVAKERTEMVTCPRDGLQGSAYVDSIYGPENAGPATHMLSCSPRDAVGEVVGALEEFCHDRGLNPRQTYVWTCSLCVNLHRCPPQLPERIADFKRYGSQIGKVLVILMPWHYPGSLGSLPSLCELWQALRLADSSTTSPKGLSPSRGRRNLAWADPGGCNGCEVTLLLPPRAAQMLREDLAYGEDAAIRAWRGLQGSWLQDAITVHEEQAPLLEVLGCGLNLFKADCFMTRALQQWLAVTLEKQLRLMLTNSALKADEADRLFDAVGWMLWETGLRELAGELLQDGLQLALQSIFPASSNRAAAASRLEVNKAMTNLEVFQLAGSLFERAGQQDTPSIATLLTHMGVAKGDAGDHQGAMEAFWHARRIRKVTGTLETVAGAVLLWNMGFALEQLGDFERAYEAYEAAKTLRRASGTLESAAGLRLQRAQLKLERGLHGANHVTAAAERSPPDCSPHSMVWERIHSPSTSLRTMETPTNQFL